MVDKSKYDINSIHEAKIVAEKVLTDDPLFLIANNLTKGLIEKYLLKPEPASHKNVKTCMDMYDTIVESVSIMALREGYLRGMYAGIDNLLEAVKYLPENFKSLTREQAIAAANEALLKASEAKEKIAKDDESMTINKVQEMIDRITKGR